MNAAEKSPGQAPAVVTAFRAVPFDLHPPPPRDWAYNRLMLYGTVSVLVGPPGVSKTTFAAQQAVCFALGLPFCGFTPRQTGNVWYLSGEDDDDEVKRRILAACKLLDVDPGRLRGKLFLNTDAGHRVVVAREERGGLVTLTPDVETIETEIRSRLVRLLVVDPFAEFSDIADENSNAKVRAVAGAFRDIAKRTRSCSLLLAHTPKSANSDNAAGDLSAIRGGGAIGGVCRSAMTMFEASKKDAENVGLDEVHRSLYVRVDQAKLSGAPKLSEPMWFRRESVGLGNGDDGDARWPEDEIGVLAQVQLTPQARKRDAEEEEAARVDILCQEVIRICHANGHTSAETTASLDDVCQAIDSKRLGAASRTARGLIISELAPDKIWGGHRIVVTSVPHGKLTLRRVHIELAEDES